MTPNPANVGTVTGFPTNNNASPSKGKTTAINRQILQVSLKRAMSYVSVKWVFGTFCRIMCNTKITYNIVGFLFNSELFLYKMSPPVNFEYYLKKVFYIVEFQTFDLPMKQYFQSSFVVN